MGAHTARIGPRNERVVVATAGHTRVPANLEEPGVGCRHILRKGLQNLQSVPPGASGETKRVRRDPEIAGQGRETWSLPPRVLRIALPTGNGPVDPKRPLNEGEGFRRGRCDRVGGWAGDGEWLRGA